MSVSVNINNWIILIHLPVFTLFFHFSHPFFLMFVSHSITFFRSIYSVGFYTSSSFSTLSSIHSFVFSFLSQCSQFLSLPLHSLFPFPFLSFSLSLSFPLLSSLWFLFSVHWDVISSREAVSRCSSSHSTTKSVRVTQTKRVLNNLTYDSMWSQLSDAPLEGVNWWWSRGFTRHSGQAWSCRCL